MKRSIIIFIITGIFVSVVFAIDAVRFSDKKLQVTFCNVGQGDAILIRTPNGKHILIDGGPDRKILQCLANAMPFWEKKIDLMILTHPHADHFMGMHYVLERYVVEQFATEKLTNKSGEFGELMQLLKDQQVPISYVAQGDRWRLPMEDKEFVLSVLGPSQEFLKRTSPNGNIGDSSEFASLVIQLSYGSFHTLFTGDSQVSGMEDALSFSDLSDTHVSILQSPHHGSKTGLNDTIVKQIAPKLAVISVGQYNRYGHPHKSILDRFAQYDIPVLRTDLAGDVQIQSDGKNLN